RWIFFVNLPIGIAAVIITTVRVGETKAANAQRPDWAGFVLFTAALATLVYGLIESNHRSFSDGLVLGCMIAAGLLLAAFLLAEAGLLLMRGLDAGSEWTHLTPGLIVSGVGVGMINPPLASTAVGVVKPERAGMASGINSTFRQVGIATGIALLGTRFTN